MLPDIFHSIMRMEKALICHINSVMHLWASKEKDFIWKYARTVHQHIKRIKELRNKISVIKNVIVVWNSTPHIFAFCSSKRFCARMEQWYVSQDNKIKKNGKQSKNEMPQQMKSKHAMDTPHFFLFYPFCMIIAVRFWALFSYKSVCECIQFERCNESRVKFKIHKHFNPDSLHFSPWKLPKPQWQINTTRLQRVIRSEK